MSYTRIFDKLPHPISILLSAAGDGIGAVAGMLTSIPFTHDNKALSYEPLVFYFMIAGMTIGYNYSKKVIHDENQDHLEIIFLPATQAEQKNSNEEKPVVNQLAQRLTAINFAAEKIKNRFLCPITQEIMQSPVIASDGHTYEESAIRYWMRHKMTSPIEGSQITINHTLYPNKDLKSEILEFVESAERSYASKQTLKR